MKKVALFLFLSVCFAQQSCSSDSVGTEPEENPQDILFKDDFNFFDEKVWTKETHEPIMYRSSSKVSGMTTVQGL